MRIKVWLGAVLITGVVTVSHAWAAETTKVTVRLENHKVKVLCITMSSPTHVTADSDDHLIIPLNDFTATETRNGKTEVLERKKGQTYCRQGGMRAYDVAGAADMIVIDLKPGKETTIK